MSKIALVTGANKGIGLETVKQLVEAGVKVYLGSRDEARGKEAAAKLAAQGLEVVPVALDLGNPATFAPVKNLIEKNHGKLDILVNNAGIQIESKIWAENTSTSISDSLLKETFQVNFFGLVELTNLLLPLIQKSEAGRIVNLTSILGSMALNADPNSPIYTTKTLAYNASKAAVNMYTIHLDHALKGTNIAVNAAHPGWVKTDMGGEVAPMPVSEGAKTSVQLALLPEKSISGQYIHLGDTLPW